MQLKSLWETLKVGMMQQGVVTSSKDILFAASSQCNALSVL